MVLALVGGVGAAELTYRPLDRAGAPPPVEFGYQHHQITDHALGSLSVDSAQGLQDARNLLYAYRFGGEAKMNQVLSEILGSDLAPKRFEQTAVYVSKISRALGLSTLRKGAVRLFERAVQLSPDDMDLMRSLATGYMNNDQNELSAQVAHLVIQRTPVKVDGDRADLIFRLSICLAERGMTTLANELFALPEVQGKDDVNWKGFVDRYGFGRPRVGIVYQERRDGAVPYVVVTKILEGSAAEVSGLRVGDRIEKIGGDRVSTQAEVAAAVGAAPLDQPFTVVVRRSGGFETLEMIKSLDSGMVLARKLTADGADAASKGDLAGAAGLFDRARKLGYRYAKAWFNTAQLALAKGDAPRALECFLAALALGLDPDLAAMARQQVEQLTLRLGGNAVFAFPQGVQQRNQLAVSLGQRGEHVKSYLNFLEVLRESPGYGGALLGVAFVEQTLGLRKQAKDHLRAFLRAYPSAPNRFVVEQTMRDLDSPVSELASGASPGAPPPGRPSFATPGAGAGPPAGPEAWGATPPNRPTGPAQWGGAGFAPQGGAGFAPQAGGSQWGGQPAQPQPAGATWGQR